MGQNGEGLGWLFNIAMANPDREERVRQLASLREQLTTRDIDSEWLELDAVVRANLAFEGSIELGDAEAAVAAAVAVGRVGWPCYYLAEAAYRCGQYKVAIEAARQVPENFFVDRELLWRHVRIREIEAAALIAGGDYESGATIATEVWDAMATEPDDEILARPTDLVSEILKEARVGQHSDAAKAQLKNLLTLSNVRDWLGPDLLDSVRSAGNS